MSSRMLRPDWILVDLNQSHMSFENLTPDFLVIGAMKSATTTMHQDLSAHPDIFCGRKELNALTSTDDAAEYRETYRYNFRSANPDQLLGDISTTYAMIPDHAGVVDKAHEVCGPNLKIIYIVRNPVSRTISHHQHMVRWNGSDKMDPNINEEIKVRPELINYSRYAFQLEPWIHRFGMDNLLVIKFEDYVSGRADTMARVFDFLRVTPIRLDLDNEGANRSKNVAVLGEQTLKLYQTRFFKRILQPLTPNFIKTFVRKLILKKPETTSIAPSNETIMRIIDGVEGDITELQRQLGMPSPFWDIEAIKDKHLVS